MPWFAIVIIGVEIALFAVFLITLVVVLVRRIKEKKNDKYKDVRY